MALTGVAWLYLETFWEPFGTLWFIYLLPVFFVLTKVLHTLRIPPLAIWLVAAALEIAPIHTGYTVIDEFASRFVYFYTGYILAARIFALAEQSQRVPEAALAGLTIWALLNGLLVFGGVAGLPFVSLGLGLAGAAAVVAISALLAQSRVFEPLRYCGEHSIVIYLAFFLGMAASRTLLLKSGWITDIGTISAIVTLAGIFGALFLYWAVRSTPLRFLFERPAAFWIAPRKPRCCSRRSNVLCSVALQTLPSGPRGPKLRAWPKPRKPAKPKKGDHVFLVDGSGYIFRAYHALPPLNRKTDGLQVNAVLGFCNMLWKLLRDMKPEERPTHLAVVFDKSEQTFRTEFYPEYKANRSAPPDDLIPQFPLIREAVHAFDIPCLEQGGFEADDLIATYVRQACELGANATIVSSDKDLMQLVNDCVVMYDTMKDKKIGIPEVIEKFGVPPDKVIEVQSLIGDSTDNVPGVPGIGVKTAAQLIGEYGDLESLLARAGEIKQEKRRQSLIDNADKARLSKRLVTLDSNVKLDVPLDDLAVHEPDYKRLISFLKAMEFNALTRRVAEFSGVDAAEIEASQSAPSREQ